MHHGHHERTEEMGEWGKHPVTRDEFAAYDIIHILCFFSLFIGMILTIMGKKGVMAAKSKKAKMVGRVFNHGKWWVLVFFVTMFATVHHCHQLGKIIKKHQKPEHHYQTLFNVTMTEQDENVEKPTEEVVETSEEETDDI